MLTMLGGIPPTTLRLSEILRQTTRAESRELLKLSTGSKAVDNAVALATVEQLTAQLNGLEQADQNVSSSQALLEVAQGGVMSILDGLQELNALTVQAADDFVPAGIRDVLSQRASEIITDINRIATDTNFNGTPLLDGSFANRNIQSGASEGDIVPVSLVDVRSSALGLDNIDVTTSTLAGQSITTTQNAIASVVAASASIGGTQNRLAVLEGANRSATQNLQASRSTLNDVDVTESTARLTQIQVLKSFAVTLMAKANSGDKKVLSILA